VVSRFHENGIAFLYPGNWTLEREEHDTGWIATIQSPGTAFLSIALFQTDELDIGVAVDESLKNLRSEYPDLEDEPAVESIAGQPAVGHDARFFSLDLTNTAGMRAFRAEAGTVLILWQYTDHEAELAEPVVRAICASIEET